MAVPLSIAGIKCGHCVHSLTTALQAVPGVDKATVSLDRGQALVDGTAGSDALIRAIEQEGYEARVMEMQ